MKISKLFKSLSSKLTKFRSKLSCSSSFEKNDFKSKYTLGKVLGKGTFGSIVEATQRHSHNTVAVKFIKKKNVESFAELNNQLLPAEALFLNHIDHPNVISLIDLFQFNSKFALVLERPLASLDLGEFIHQYGPQNSLVSSHIANQLISVYAFLHSSLIFHRDTKSENILINYYNYQIKIIDFGSSCWIDREDFSGSFGTPAFSPPEWLIGSHYQPEPTTIWAIGVVMFEVISGSLPFSTEHHVLKGTLTFPDHVSPIAKDFLRSILQLEPSDRPTYSEISSHQFLDQDLPDENDRVLDTSTYSKCSSYTIMENPNAELARECDDFPSIFI